MPNAEVPLPPTVEELLQEIACKCDRKAGNKRTDTCAEQGTKKHDCCENEIQKHNASGKPPSVGGERGYDQAGNRLNMTREQAVTSGQGRGTCWPDACATDPQGNPTQLFDFKFKCPAGSKTRKKKKGGRYWHRSGDTDTYPTWTQYKGGRTQEDKYIALGNKLNPPIDSDVNPPTVINTEDCN